MHRHVVNNCCHVLGDDRLVMTLGIEAPEISNISLSFPFFPDPAPGNNIGVIKFLIVGGLVLGELEFEGSISGGF